MALNSDLDDVASLAERPLLTADAEASREAQETGWQEELWEIAKIAGPSTLNTIASNSMNVADLAILGHYGTEELAAASFAAVWINISMTLIYRSCGATNVLCAQAFGAGNFMLVGQWLQLSSTA